MEASSNVVDWSYNSLHVKGVNFDLGYTELDFSPPLPEEAIADYRVRARDKTSVCDSSHHGSDGVHFLQATSWQRKDAHRPLFGDAVHTHALFCGRCGRLRGRTPSCSI